MERKIEAIKNNPGISRVYVKDAKGKWSPPLRGNGFRAIRQVRKSDGTSARETRYFATMAEAQAFRRNEMKTGNLGTESLVVMTFEDLFERWKLQQLSHLELSTRVRYLSYRQHFRYFDLIRVEEITPSTIDHWLTAMKAPDYIAKSNRTRCNYSHEFIVLKGILRFYQERINPHYRLPFRRDHLQMLTVRKGATVMKDLNVGQYHSFINALKCICEEAGDLTVWFLARTQYVTATRIQEAAALRAEDFDLSIRKVHIQRRIQWSRSRGVDTVIREGTKAGRGKTLDILPDTMALLAELKLSLGVRDGFLFQANGKPLSYRQIEYRYNQAFKRASIPFRGTHIVRHAAVSEVHAHCKDLVVTAAIAGHSDIKSTARYAKPRAEAVQKAMEHLGRAEAGGVG